MLDFLIYPLSLIVVLGIMIVVHELGHHLVAKWCGVRVEVFSVGFGKRLFGYFYKGTDYRVSLLPFGGYVKMAGENPMESRTGDPGEFMSHPRWQRILIAIAGPAMNILLAIALLTGVFMFNYEHPAFLEKPADVFSVDENSAAARAGIQPGDRIIRVEDKQSPTWEDVLINVYLRAPQPVDMAIMRGNELIQLKLVPESNDPSEGRLQGLNPQGLNVVSRIEENMPAYKAGLRKGDEIVAINSKLMPSMEAVVTFLQENKDKPVDVTALRQGKEMHFQISPFYDSVEKRFRIGFGSNGAVHVDRLSFPQALSRSLQENKKNSLLIGTMLKKLVKREVSIKKMDGPLGIARETGRAAKAEGWTPILYLMSIISLNLGVFNLLPIPILDGGLILLTMIEGIMRRDINQRLKERIYQTAFVFLVIFAVVVMYNDVTKFSIFSKYLP
jgi:regulator of sigma E protease